jgi:hypothetical protein
MATIAGHRRRGALLVASVAAALLPAGLALAAGAKTDTFTLSGQESGTMTLNSSETCQSGNIEGGGGETSVRLYLTDHGVKPTSALWFIIIEAKKTGKISFPAPSPTEVSLGADKGASTAAEWTAEAGEKASGTLLLNPGFKGGTISLTLPPSTLPQKGAKSPEKISGSWSCS